MNLQLQSSIALRPNLQLNLTFLHVLQGFGSQTRFLSSSGVQVIDDVYVGNEQYHVLLSTAHGQSHEFVQVVQSRAQNVAHQRYPCPCTVGHQIFWQSQVPEY